MDMMDRFDRRNDSDIDNLLSSKDSDNTRRMTKYAVKAFTDFLIHYTVDDGCYPYRSFGTRMADDKPIEWDLEDLNTKLKHFYANTRKQNGEYYKKNSFAVQRHGLARFFRMKNIDILNNSAFSDANLTFAAALVELKKLGKGSVDHFPSIVNEDLTKLYSWNLESPRDLQKKVLFDIIFYMCRRGSENLVSMTKETFVVDTTEGRRFIRQNIDELDKNHRVKDDELPEGRIYEVAGHQLCPVSSFQTYLSKLNPKCNRLWQRPREVPSNESWYCNSPVGKNTLSSFMSNLSEERELSQSYTNHCIRVTAISALNLAQFEARHIMAVSGHKSEASIRNYSRGTAAQTLASMSSVLAENVGIPAVAEEALVQPENNVQPKNDLQPENDVHQESNFAISDSQEAFMRHTVSNACQAVNPFITKSVVNFNIYMK